jgi:hypothetical protein
MKPLRYRLQLLSLALLAPLLLSSCINLGNSTNDPTRPTNAVSTVLVACEGKFLENNADVTGFDRISKAVVNGVFRGVNGRALGDILQSITLDKVNNVGYLVVNNSNRVEAVDLNSFRTIGQITGIILPRYIALPGNEKGYVSEWVDFSGTGNIVVVNLRTFAVERRIAVGKFPERLMQIGTRLYVSSGNGDNRVFVIDLNTNLLTATWTMPVANPNSFAVDQNGRLWVACSGINDFTTPANNTPGALISLDASTGTVIQNIPVAVGIRANKLTTDATRSTLYFLGGAPGTAYRMAITATVPQTFFSNTPLRPFYGIDVDPVTNQVFLADAGNFVAAGKVITWQTTPRDSFTVDVAPGEFAF